jgi:amino acid transporter
MSSNPSARSGADAHAPALVRVLGLRDVVFFFIVAVVGTRWIATAAALGPSALVVWGIAFVAFFLPLAFSVVELASRHPDEGGIYVWTRRAFGEGAGFICGWLYWVSNIVFLPTLLYFAAACLLHVGGPTWLAWSENAGYFIVFSLLGIGLGLWANLVGLDVGTKLHNAGAYGTWIPVALLIGLGFASAARFGSATDFASATWMPSTSTKDFVFWSTLAFGFGGFEAAAFMGGEIREPRRTIPRAILIAGIIVTAIYVVGTLAVLLALPASEVRGLDGLMQAISRSASRVGMAYVTPVAALLMAVGALGGAGAWLASTARLPFVAGLHHALPPAFGRLHPRWRTPHVALLTQAGVSAVLIVLGQAGTSVRAANDVLVAMSVLTYFVPFLFLFAAMIRLQREPAGPEVMRVPGGRRVAIPLAVVGFLTTLISIGLATIPPADEQHPAIAVLKIVGGTVVLTAVGWGFYRRRAVRA